MQKLNFVIKMQYSAISCKYRGSKCKKSFSNYYFISIFDQFFSFIFDISNVKMMEVLSAAMCLNSPSIVGMLKQQCLYSPPIAGMFKQQCLYSLLTAGMLKHQCLYSPLTAGMLKHQCLYSPPIAGMFKQQRLYSPFVTGMLKHQCLYSPLTAGMLKHQCLNLMLRKLFVALHQNSLILFLC